MADDPAMMSSAIPARFTAQSLSRQPPLDLLLDSVLRYLVPEMKTSIPSALIAAALALSATAQDCNDRIALGMTFADVAARLGQPVSVSNKGPVSNNGPWWCYLNDNPISVSNEGVETFNLYSYMVAFDNNGRVSMWFQHGQSQ
jgi:hypothetical protein